jgi:hypothetical protein
MLPLAERHPAVLRFPAVIRLLGDPVNAAKIRDLPPGLAFLDDGQDLG